MDNQTAAMKVRRRGRGNRQSAVGRRRIERRLGRKRRGNAQSLFEQAKGEVGLDHYEVRSRGNPLGLPLGWAGIGTSRWPCWHSPTSPPFARRLPGVWTP